MKTSLKAPHTGLRLAAHKFLVGVLFVAGAVLTLGRPQAMLRAPYQVGHSWPVTFLDWTADSAKVVSYSAQDKAIRVWRVSDGRVLAAGVLGPAATTIEGAMRVRVEPTSDRKVELRDSATGQLLWLVPIDQVSIRSKSPDGKFSAEPSTGYDLSIQIVETASGQRIQRLEGHPGVVSALAFSPKGSLLASANGDETATIRLALDGQLVSTLTGATGPLFAVSFSPDGLLVAAAGDDNRVRMWDVASGVLRRTLTGHERPVRAVSFVSNSKSLVSGGEDDVVKIWNTDTGALMGSIPIPGWRRSASSRWCCGSHIATLASSPSGLFVAVGCQDGYTYLLDIQQRRLATVGVGEGFSTRPGSVQFSSDSEWEWIVAETGLGIRRHSGSKETHVVLEPTVKYVVSAGVTAVSSRFAEAIAVATTDSRVRVINTHNGETLWDWRTTAPARSVAFSPDGSYLAVGGDDQNISVLDVGSGKLLWAADRLR